MTVVLLAGLITSTDAQVATGYTWAQSSSAYTSVGVAGSNALLPDGWDDDQATVALPFTFYYDGLPYTQITVSSNGFLVFGGSLASNGVGAAYQNPSSRGHYLSGTATEVGFAGFNVDLAERTFPTITATSTNGSTTLTGVSDVSNLRPGMRLSGTGIPANAVVVSVGVGTVTLSSAATGAGSTTLTPRSNVTACAAGTAPNRRFVVQWSRATRGILQPDDLNFQLILSEGGGDRAHQTLQVNYGTCTTANPSASGNPEVGIRTTTSDYNNRTTNNNWNATTNGTANTSRCRYSSSIYPASGLLFTWTPDYCQAPVAPGTIAGTSPICTGTGTTLTLTGASASTYGLSTAWYWSAAAGGPYTNSAGTGASIATGNLTATRYYIATTTCANGPASASTPAFAVVVNNPASAANAGPDRSVCSNAGVALAATVPASGTGTWSVVSGPSTLSSQLSSTSANNATFTPAGGAGTYTLRWTVSSSPCTPNTQDDMIVTVAAVPTGVTASSSPATVCAGSTTNLSATGSGDGTLFSMDFNSGAGSWTTTNGSTGGTPANAAWTLRPDGYTYASFFVFHSNDASQFFLSNSDSQGSGGTTSTTLVSPAFSTVGLTAASLVFHHFYRFNSGASDRAYVEASTNGTTWNTLQTYSSTQGALTNFVTATVNLSSVLGQPNVYVRFRYNATYDWWWAIDNVSVTGTGSPLLTWSWTSTPAGFTSANQNPSGVVVGQTTSYKVTATAQNGCAASALTPVTAVPAPNAGSNGTLTVCSNGAPVNLIGSLGGSPQAGGNWTFGGNPHGATLDPATDAGGVYTYTVNGTAPCPNATATVTVTRNTATAWYADVDGDGSGDPANSVMACAQPPGYVNNNGDGCPSDPNKIAPGICGCGTADTDSDGDGTANCNDGCPNDPNKIAPGLCGCGTADVDTDGDGTADCNDGCPDDPSKIAPGQCGCGEPDVDSDGDGVLDCDDDCPNDPNKINPGFCGCGMFDGDSDGDGVADCADGCPNDPLKLNPGACGCGVLDIDSDGDGYMDCVDGCPNDPLKISPGQCGCGVIDTDTDGDGIPDCLDSCPLVAGQAGDPCDDGDATTLNDVLTANCTCAGTPTIADVELVLGTDNDGANISWEIDPIGGGAPICSGSGYANNATIVVPCTVPTGCYELLLLDAHGDGMCCLQGNGGYVLRTGDGRRIIDAANAGVFGTSAQVSNHLGFCLPLGTDRLTPSRCDRENYLPSDFIEATPNAAVSAQWGVGDQSDDGYQFWFFNPNGGYTRRVLVTHATGSYLFPGGPARCSYLRLNSFSTNPLPHDVLLNVRVRSLVNGVYSAFGPACRFKIDLTDQCPTTHLVDDVNDAHLSCGMTNAQLDGSTVLYTVPVSGANKYQFEFTCPGYLRKISNTGSGLVLTRWATLPLQGGQTYAVRVRVSFDNGTNYCPFGSSCTVTVSNASQGTQQRAVVSTDRTHALQLWPNPDRDGRVHLALGGFTGTTTPITIRIVDLSGKVVLTQQMDVEGEALNTVLDLQGLPSRGMYFVNVVSPTDVWTERLVVE